MENVFSLNVKVRAKNYGKLLKITLDFPIRSVLSNATSIISLKLNT